MFGVCFIVSRQIAALSFHTSAMSGCTFLNRSQETLGWLGSRDCGKTVGQGEAEDACKALYSHAASQSHHATLLAARANQAWIEKGKEEKKAVKDLTKIIPKF